MYTEIVTTYTQLNTATKLIMFSNNNKATWVLKEAIIQKLLVFERKILRRIFGPTKENQICRVKTDEELDKLIKHKNMINP